MKNLFASFLLVGAICLVSCDGKKSESTSDSLKTDSSAVMTTDTASTTTVDTAKADTAAMHADTAKTHKK